MKILVIDDDKVSLGMMKMILEQYGQVDTCEDGREGFIAFQKALNAFDPYRLVAVDIMMPGLDGQSTIRSMRASEAQKGLPPGNEAIIFIVTQLEKLPNHVAFMNAIGPASYVKKPLNQNTIVSKLLHFGLL